MDVDTRVCHINNFFLRFNSSADFPGPWSLRSIGVGADKILVKDGVMLLSNKANRNFAALSACIADSFRHDVCVFVLSIETHLTQVKLHFCSVWPKYW